MNKNIRSKILHKVGLTFNIGITREKIRVQAVLEVKDKREKESVGKMKIFNEKGIQWAGCVTRILCNESTRKKRRKVVSTRRGRKSNVHLCVG